jgi:hypothetical protein
MDNKNEKQPVQLTPELIDLVKTILAESKKPSELEELQIKEMREKNAAKQAAIQHAQDERKRSAAAQKEMREAKKLTQKTCLHESGKPNPHSHAVFVNDQFGGYILCQKCAVVVRKQEARSNYAPNYSGTIVFDSELFNRLFQMTNESGLFGG